MTGDREVARRRSDMRSEYQAETGVACEIYVGGKPILKADEVYRYAKWLEARPSATHNDGGVGLGELRKWCVTERERLSGVLGGMLRVTMRTDFELMIAKIDELAATPTDDRPEVPGVGEIYCGRYPDICNHQCGHSNRMCDDAIECKDKKPAPATDKAGGELCDRCHGDGGPPGNECPYCDGTGQSAVDNQPEE